MRDQHLVKMLTGFTLGLWLAACGGGGGGGDNASGTTAGFLVVEHVNAANPAENGIRVHRADQPGATTSEIAGALFERDAAGRPMRVGSGGVVYAVPEIAGTTEYKELGIFLSSTRVILGSTPNHRYRWMGMIPSNPPRVVFRDQDELGRYRLVSANLDGGDVRTLSIACDFMRAPADPGFDPLLSAAGIVFHCTNAGVEHWYYSDGTGPAVMLPYTGNDAFREPKALSASTVVMYSPSQAYLTRQAIDGVGLEQALFEADDPNIFHYLEYDPRTGRLALGPGGEVVVRWERAGDFRHLVVQPDNGQIVTGTNVPGTGRYGTSQVVFKGISPDGTKGLSVLFDVPPGNLRDDLLVLPLGGGSETQINLGGDHAKDAMWIPNGKIVVNKCDSAGICATAISPAAGNFIARADGTLESENILSKPFLPIASSGNHVVLRDGTLKDVRTIDSVAYTTPASPLCTDCTSPGLTARADGYVTFVDDAGAGWIANLPAGTAPVRIDNVPTTRVIHVGEGAGNRLFFTMQRAAGDHDVVVFDLDTMTATTLIGGPADDYGFFFAN